MKEYFVPIFPNSESVKVVRHIDLNSFTPEFQQLWQETDDLKCYYDETGDIMCENSRREVIYDIITF